MENRQAAVLLLIEHCHIILKDILKTELIKQAKQMQEEQKNITTKPMENKQTAVDWLIKELGEYFPHDIGGINYMVERAKQIEKEQIKEAWKDSIWHRTTEEVLEYSAEEYYNETYGK